MKNDKWVLSERLKITSVFHELTGYLSDLCSIFDSFKWPYYRNQVNQITLNHTTLKILALLIFKVFVLILLVVNLSLELNLPWYSYFMWDKLGRLNCSNFSLRGHFTLFQKHSVTHMNGLAVYVTSFCTSLIYRKLRGFLFMDLTDFASFSTLLPFPLLVNFLSFVHGFWCY